MHLPLTNSLVVPTDLSTWRTLRKEAIAGPTLGHQVTRFGRVRFDLFPQVANGLLHRLVGHALLFVICPGGFNQIINSMSLPGMEDEKLE